MERVPTGQIQHSIDCAVFPVEIGDYYLMLATICIVWQTLAFLDFVRWVDRKATEEGS